MNGLKQTRTLSIFFVCIAICSGPAAIGASLVGVEFYQLNFNLDGVLQADSDWGVVDLTFIGDSAILYLNIEVDGSWQVENMPVLSLKGEGVEQTQRFWFDLGNPVGVNVSTLNYRGSLTYGVVAGVSGVTTTVVVPDDDIIIYSGGKDAVFNTTPPPAEPSVGGEVADPEQHKNDFPNQEAGVNECVPTAVSNSLLFLGLDEDDVSIEKMKTATNWDPLGCWINHDDDRPEGQKNAWWEDKDAYMKANDLPITTKQVLPADIAQIIAEIDDGQDIEMELNGHTVAVVGMTDLGDGKYSVTIAHDTKQGVDGGTVEETGTWDSNTSTWGGALAGCGYGLNYFIVECPIPPDVHATVPGDQTNGSYLEFGTGDMPAIPADFFGPGSDPFTGPILLEGDPPDPLNFDDISTIVQRFGEPVAPTDPLGSSGTIPIEIVELNLKSIGPIIVEYLGGAFTEEWDMHVGLSQVPSLPGQLTATKTHDNGGTYDASFYIQPVFTFTRVSDHTTYVLDTGEMLMPPLQFNGTSSWVHSVNPCLDIIAPGDGSFVPGVLETIPGVPSSQRKQEMAANEASGAARHTVIPATHSPSIPGDINNDRYVNLIDVAILFGNYLECNAPSDPECTWAP